MERQQVPAEIVIPASSPYSSGQSTPTSLPASLLDSFSTPSINGEYTDEILDTKHPNVFPLETTLQMQRHTRNSFAETALKVRQETFKKLQQRSKEEIELIRRKQAYIEAELPRLRAKLKVEKEAFDDLVLSEELYNELRQQPAANLTVKEYAQIRLHEALQHDQIELEKTRKELSKLKAKLGVKTETADSTVQELTHKVNMAQTRERNLQSELRLSEATSKEFESKIQGLTKELDELRQRTKGFEDMELKNEVLATENKQLRDQLSKATENLMNSSEVQDGLQIDMKDLNRKLEILRTDKEYLVKENNTFRTQTARNEEELANLRDKVTTAEREKMSFYEQLTKAKDENRAHYQELLDKELKKLHEESAKEIIGIRERGQGIWERENQILRQARDEALEELDRVRSKLTEMQKSHEEQLLRQTRIETSMEGKLSELRNELKMKTFEINRVGGVYEEKLEELRKSKLEIDMLRQKLDVHKAEFSKLETTSAKTIMHLEGQLKTEEEKVATYEQMEVDLDNAVLQASGLDAFAISHDSTVMQDTSNLKQIENIMGSIPTRSKRRFRQSVILAQQLLASEQSNERLKRELKEKEDELQKTQLHLQKFQQQHLDLGQPKNYLVNKMYEKDMTIDRLRKDIESMAKELQESEAQRQASDVSKDLIKEELRELLSKREDLSSIRHLLLSIQTEQQQQKEFREKKLRDQQAVQNLSPGRLKISLENVRPKCPSSEVAVKQVKLPKWYSRLRH